MNGGQRGTYYLRSFGCQMNDHDSERIAGILDEMVLIQRALVSEKRVMHFPEFPLRGSRFCRLSRLLRVWVGSANGEVTEYVEQIIAKSLLGFFHNRMRLQTVRAFVVAILDENNRGIRIPLIMIPVSDLRG